MDYIEIARRLRLDTEGDEKAAKLLDNLIEEPDLKPLESIIDRCIIVFGAGPSLIQDIDKIISDKLHTGFVLIAADGAVKALLEHNMLPQIQVTDLDGDIKAIIEANRRGVITVVHAHADNMEKIREFVPELRNVIGTTQLKPFGRLHNFGGFTDGDRAVYLAEHFKSGLIVLAGMDFGSEIGEYSGSYDRELKPRKLRIGKTLLEELAERSHAGIVNLTDKGEQLRGIPGITVKQLRTLSAQMS
ncbi:MAG: DUF115 domain-containing protein [Candidatus Altiarchaeota archaeon]|nr:DUF115 domain-containing protein [Candidatus Altiarchaeota archaeon]